jgi:hypothetical protein
MFSIEHIRCICIRIKHIPISLYDSCIVPYLFIYLFICSTGVWTHGLHLEPSPPAPFFWCFFYLDKVSWTICPSWLQTVILLIYVSWVARITAGAARAQLTLCLVSQLNHLVQLHTSSCTVLTMEIGVYKFSTWRTVSCLSNFKLLNLSSRWFAGLFQF